jgi:predicted amidohydrolase
LGKQIRVVTTCQNDDRRFDNVALAERAMALGPDILCLPECFSKVGIKGGRDAEPVPGPTTRVFMRMAREHACYVVCPLRTRREGRVWNSAVLIDRSGAICGIYDKLHPVTSRYDYTSFEGVVPGTSAPVFDLDFGRVAVQICFDAGFPETWADLAAQGARLVFWPSAYNGGFLLRTYAYLHQYYVVSSVRTDHARIIDPCGAVLAETTPRQQLVYRDLNLDFVVAHYDFNCGIPARIQAAYGDRVTVRSYFEEGHFLVEPVDDTISCRQLQEEFGFEDTGHYHDRHRIGYAAIARGRKPPTQQAAHGRRPQWSQ